MTKPIHQYNGINYVLTVNSIDEKYEVNFSFTDRDWSTSVELCNTKEHALHGATQFPKFYEMSQHYGYNIREFDFVHPDGRTVNLTCAMDVDRTQESFEQLLINGEVVEPMSG